MSFWKVNKNPKKTIIMPYIISPGYNSLKVESRFLLRVPVPQSVQCSAPPHQPGGCYDPQEESSPTVSAHFIPEYYTVNRINKII